MLLIPQTNADASKVLLLSFDFPVPSFRYWSYYFCGVALVSSCFASHISGGGTTPLFSLFCTSLFYCLLFLCFFVPFAFLSVNKYGLLRSFCMHVSYPARWPVIALLLCLVHYNVVLRGISVSWFCNHRAFISLGGRIDTDTGCAGCRRIERTAECEEPPHTCWVFSVHFPG